MLNNSMPVALITSSQPEADVFMKALSECGFRRVTIFTSAKEAYEICTRQQFPIFITRMEMPDMSGIVLLQKLRLTGNYGLEPHLFVCDKLESKLVSVLSEHDIDYVLVPPLDKGAIALKFQHLISTENNLSELELQYRDAKSAFSNKMFDMAESFVKNVLVKNSKLEKAIILLGDIEAKHENFAAANKQYKLALEVNPKSAAAAHKLAEVFMTQGDFKQAAVLLDQLADINPYNIKVLENAGLSNLNVERYDQAKVHMTNLTSQDDTSKTAATLTAQIRIKTGDYSGLIDGLKKAHNEKEVIQFLNNSGAKLSAENNIDGALKMYQAAIEQITSNKFMYAIHYNMGIAYKKKSDTAKAIFNLEKSIKLNPEFTKAIAVLEDLKKPKV